MVSVKQIERIVAEFEIWVDESFPFPKFKVKVVDREGDYKASPNVVVRNCSSGDPEFICGLGDSVDEALQDLLSRFIDDCRQQCPPDGFAESNFFWSACEDF